MESITLGSVENLVVDVQDQLHQLAVLPNPTGYRVIRDSDNHVMVASNAVTTGMRALCLIDTTTPGWVVGRYTLQLTFASGLEIPVLDAGKFHVNL